MLQHGLFNVGKQEHVSPYLEQLQLATSTSTGAVQIVHCTPSTTNDVQRTSLTSCSSSEWRQRELVCVLRTAATILYHV